MRVFVVTCLVLSAAVLPALADQDGTPAPSAEADDVRCERTGGDGGRWEGFDADPVENPHQWCPGG